MNSAYNTDGESFLGFGKLPYYFLSLDQLPTFYVLRFQCHEISPGVPTMGSFFASITSSWTSSSYLSQPLSSFVLLSLSSLSSESNIPTVGCLVMPCTLHSCFPSSVTTFPFFAATVLLASSFSWSSLLSVAWVYPWEKKG